MLSHARFVRALSLFCKTELKSLLKRERILRSGG